MASNDRVQIDLRCSNPGAVGSLLVARLGMPSSRYRFLGQNQPRGYATLLTISLDSRTFHEFYPHAVTAFAANYRVKRVGTTSIKSSGASERYSYCYLPYSL